MEVSLEQVRAYRVLAHHLDGKFPVEEFLSVAGVCGLQNSPPGAWETALWNRLNGCSLEFLHDALYREKSLLQAWSYRGVPVVFPTADKDVFLTTLRAYPDEDPWIYTQGIGLALDHLQMSFEELLPIVKKAAGYLDGNTAKSKEELDRVLAKEAEQDIPSEKLSLWQAPSMYGNPDKQTVGGAVVSFLLRPCSFSSLVVFGEREGSSPTLTSMKNWLGFMPEPYPDAERELVRRFLHCYGPTTLSDFTGWLGCSSAQGKRLWESVSDEMVLVLMEGKIRYILADDRESLMKVENNPDQLLLLGPHDPYLDPRGKNIILPEKSHHKAIWQTVSNPGAITKGGRIIGVWKSKSAKDTMDISIMLWDLISGKEEDILKNLSEEYARFRQKQLRSNVIEKKG